MWRCEKRNVTMGYDRDLYSLRSDVLCSVSSRGYRMPQLLLRRIGSIVDRDHTLLPKDQLPIYGCDQMNYMAIMTCKPDSPAGSRGAGRPLLSRLKKCCSWPVDEFAFSSTCAINCAHAHQKRWHSQSVRCLMQGNSWPLGSGTLRQHGPSRRN